MIRFYLVLIILLSNIGCEKYGQTLTDRTLDSELRCKQYCDKNYPEFKNVKYSISDDGYLKACECTKSL
jgi:hypothetical protein